MSDQNTNSGLVRRRSKILQFVIVEIVAILLLLLFASSAVLVRWNDSTLALLINILTIVAAAAVAIIPIAFFAIAPVLPRSDKPGHD
jgi:di/tricarboxylate transporter